MRKIIIQKEFICPFDKCIIPDGEDKLGNLIYNEMSIRCQNCEHIWDRKRKTIKIGCVDYLKNDSEEYKEYCILHGFSECCD